MNQQELEMIVNHIVVKQDELLNAVNSSKEVDISEIQSKLDTLQKTLECFITETGNKDLNAREKFGEKLKRQLENGRELNMLMVRNCELLEDVKTIHQNNKNTGYKKLKEWFNRNIAWLAFFSLCITFCITIYYIQLYNNTTQFQHLTETQMRQLDLYLIRHPHGVDSLLSSEAYDKKP